MSKSMNFICDCQAMWVIPIGKRCRECGAEHTSQDETDLRSRIARERRDKPGYSTREKEIKAVNPY